MRKINILFLVIMSLFVISACGAESEAEETKDLEELPTLDVEFEPPTTAEVGEAVELVARVTYDDEPVTDASQIDFEYWLEDDEDDSEMVEAKNNDDGTYSYEVSFDEAGEYSIYAHTSAHDLHTMPKRSIQVSE